MGLSHYFKGTLRHTLKKLLSFNHTTLATNKAALNALSSGIQVVSTSVFFTITHRKIHHDDSRWPVVTLSVSVVHRFLQ